MRFPWARSEQREAGGFTNTVTQALIAAAEGANTAQTLAATEVAAGLYGRAFSSAAVSGDPYGLLTAGALETIGREFTKAGESVHLIDVRGRRRPADPGIVLGHRRRRRSAVLAIPRDAVRSDHAENLRRAGGVRDPLSRECRSQATVARALAVGYRQLHVKHGSPG